MMESAYKRILLKLSGEVLGGEKGFGVDFDKVNEICQSIKKCTETGTQIAIVVGGGNFWRGRSSGEMDRTRADHMGMLATVMNSIALCDTLIQLGVPAVVQTAIEMRKIAEPYVQTEAVKHLKEGKVVIFGCGTGNPYFSTDTAAALRAIEIGADIMFKATNVDGVYDSDPKTNKNAVKFDKLSLADVINKELHVMDITAASLCKDNKMPILVFNLEQPDNIVDALSGKNVGTIVE
ncbi:MAG: UMP kinase [Oscillospiraceae bacterium]|nr:UMP kinase [Candidatus Equicaccousia limihippi]